MNMPDFSKYSLDELYDTLNHIDKTQYPDRVQIITELIKQKEGNPDLFTENESSRSMVDALNETPKALPKKIDKVEVLTAEGEKIEQRLATRGQRLGASLLDALFITIPFFLIVISFISLQETLDIYSLNLQEQVLLFFLGQIIFLGFNGYFLWKNGQTIGKKIVGTRIVTLQGSIPRFLPLYLRRYISISLIGYIPVIGMLFSLVNILFIFRKDLRCIHDHIAYTRVIMA